MHSPEAKFCCRPIPMKAETASGDHTFALACRSRIARVCEFCAHQFLLRARTVFYSAISPSPRLFDNQGNLQDVVNHLEGYKVFFVTATAPSFGVVHNRPKVAPHRCSACGQTHKADDEILGFPVDPERYKFQEAVAWNRAAPELLRNTLQRLRRYDVRDVQYCGVFEVQTRGALHFHGLIAIDSDCSSEELADLLRSCFSASPDSARPVSAKTLIPGYRARWGAQVDVQRLLESVPPASPSSEVDGDAEVDSGTEINSVTSAVRYVSKCLNYTTKQFDDLGMAELEPSLMLRKLAEVASEFYLEHNLRLPAHDAAFVGASVKGIQRSRGWGLSLTDLHELALLKHADSESNFDRESATYRRITNDEFRSAEAQTRAFVDEDSTFNRASNFPLNLNENSWFPSSQIPYFTPASPDSVEPLIFGAQTLTNEQSAVIHSVLSNPVTVVSSGAGTGKTTAVAALVEVLAEREDNMFFSSLTNAAISAFISCLPKGPGVTFHVETSTLHKLAWEAIFPEFNFDSEMRAEKASLLCNLASYPANFHQIVASRYDVLDVRAGEYFATAEQVCAFALHALKRFCASADNALLADHVRCPADLAPAVLNLARQLAEDTIFSPTTATAHLISFATLLKRYCMMGPLPFANVLLLDEAQDLPASVVHLVNRFVESSRQRRVLIIGDLYQQLFGFTGASADLFTVPAVSLALTTSFRFPQKIADDANRFLPDSAPKLVSAKPTTCTAPEVEAQSLKDFDSVLCVTNRRARQLIADALYLGLQVTSPAYSDLALSRLQSLRKIPIESRRAHIEAQKPSLGADTEAWNLALKLASDPVLMHLAPSYEANLTVSTVHRAKGFEWDRVLLTNEIFDVRISDAVRYVAHSRARIVHVPETDLAA